MPSLKKFLKLTKGGQDETSDLKSFEIYAQDISEEIARDYNKDGDGYIFAISAKWGAGKTKLLKLIRPRLEAQGFEVVTYNAWQYAQDPDTLRRTFLKNLNKKLTDNKFFYWFKGKGKLLSRLDNEQTKTSLPLPSPMIFWSAALATGVFLFLANATFLDHNLLANIKQWTSNIVEFAKTYPFLSGAITFLVTLFAVPKLLQIEKKSSKVTSTDEFETIFKKIIRRHKKLVIFIDDLDRCTPEGAKLVLDALKTFFIQPRVSYIVTGDHTVLERYMGEQMKIPPVYDKDGSIDQKSTEIAIKLEGQRFMQKIFNVYWKLPVLEPSEKDHLIEKNLAENPYLKKRDRIAIKALLVAHLDKTPREIIRFTSLLRFSLKTTHTRLEKLKDDTDDTAKQIAANLEEIKKRPGLLAKVLLMQEKFDETFNYFSEDPASYADIEKRVLSKGSKKDADKKWQDLLGQGTYEKFIDFISTPPTFYSKNGAVLLTSPEVFFYYSGFAGTNSAGIISEDFLARYIVPDEALAEDFRVTAPKTNREKMLTGGIDHLEKITDTTQLSTAIDQLVGLFEVDDLEHQSLIMSLVNSPSATRDWQSRNGTTRQELLERLVKLALKHRDAALFEALVNQEPWNSEINPMWQHIDFSVVSESFIQVVAVYLKSQGTVPEAEAVRKQFLDQNTKALSESDSRSAEALKLASYRILEDPYKLDLHRFVDEGSWNSILVGLLNNNVRNRASIFLDALSKNHSLWVGAVKPKGINLFRRKTKFHQQFGQRALDIFDSWK